MPALRLHPSRHTNGVTMAINICLFRYRFAIFNIEECEKNQELANILILDLIIYIGSLSSVDET